MAWIFPLLLLILFEIIADIFSKQWALSGSWIMWAGAVIGYIIANVFWLFAIRSGSELARGALMFTVGAAIVAVLLGVFIYKEELSAYQLIGMGLGIISLIFIFWN